LKENPLSVPSERTPPGVNGAEPVETPGPFLIALAQRPTSDVDEHEEVGPYNPLAVKTVEGANSSVVSAFAQETVTIGNTAGTLTQAVFSGAVRATIAVETASIRFRIDGGPPAATVGILANPGDIIVLPHPVMIANFQAIRTTSVSATIWAIYESGLPGGLGFQVIRGQSSDGLGNTNVNLNTLISGEDTTNQVIKVEQRFSYLNSTGGTTAVNVKGSSGFLHAVIINTPAAGSIKLFDGSGGAGSSIGVLAASNPAGTYIYDVLFQTALSFVPGSATLDVTISYR
jgi:hypothetical protein